MFSGRNKTEATRAPKKRGIPPPRGIGLEWIIAGWRLTFGSSSIPIFFKITNESGVITAVAKSATTKGRKIRLFKILLHQIISAIVRSVKRKLRSAVRKLVMASILEINGERV